MFPDKNTPQAQSQPVALPQVQSTPLQSAGFAQQNSNQIEQNPVHELPRTIEQIKMLTEQYGSNPYAFNSAFQQVKSQYLLEHFHIDPNLEKN